MPGGMARQCMCGLYLFHFQRSWNFAWAGKWIRSTWPGVFLLLHSVHVEGMCAKNASSQARVCICTRAGFLVWQTPRLPAALFSAAGPFHIPRSESNVEELRTPSIRYGLPAWARIPQMKTLQIIHPCVSFVVGPRRYAGACPDRGARPSCFPTIVPGRLGAPVMTILCSWGKSL